MKQQSDGASRSADTGSSETSSFLASEGGISALVAANDWSRSPLGPPESWPQSLKSAFDLMVPTMAQIVLFWGPDYVALYNDAYAPTIGDKHPRAFGRPAVESWTELWDDLEPLLRQVRETGRTVYAKDRPFYIERHGYPETVYFDISYSPVPEGEGVGGVLCIVSETTERVKSEQTIRESEARFHAMADSIDQMIWSTRPDGYHDYYNKRWYEFTGVPDGSTDGEGWNDMFHPDDRERAWEVWRHSLTTGEPYHIEYRLKHRSGAYRWVLGRAQPVRDEDGDIVRWYGTCTDVDALKTAEETLREAEARYRLALAATNDAIWDWDFQSGYVRWNEALEDAYGHKLAEVEPTGEWWFEQIHPDDRQRVHESIHAVIDGTGTQWSEEYRFRRADGSYAHVFDRGAVIRDESGRSCRMIGAMLDLTERRRAETAIAAASERLRLATETAAIGTWDFDPESGCLQWDDRTKELFGLHSDADVDYDAFLRALHPDDKERVDAAVQGALSPEGSGEYNVEYRTVGVDDGIERWIAARGGTVFIGGKAARFIGTVIDISERKRADQALRESEERFRQVFQNAAVGMIEIDADWNILASNDAYLEIAGRSEADLRGANCLSFTHPDDVAAGEQALRALAAGKTSRVAFEKRYFRPDGEIVWVRSSLSRVSGEQSTNRFLKVVEDITEIRNAREALREEGQALEILNRTAARVAAELDLDTLVQTVTDAGVELTGAQFGAFFYNVTDEKGEWYTLYALSGVDRSYFDKFPMPRNTHIFGPTFAGEGVVRSADITKDPRYGKMAPYYGMPPGHLPVHSYLAVPVVSRSGEVIGGLFFGHEKTDVFSDRSERLMTGLAAQAAIGIDNARLFQAEQRLNQTLEQRVTDEVARRSEAEERLRQAQKMETVGQLTGGLAHDFNNLLQIVTGNLDILLRNLPGEQPRLRRSAENAMRGAERASTLTQRLLAFSRRQPLAPKPIDANKLVSAMEELLHRTLGETIEVETVLSPGLWRIEADPNQLENTILNLAVNARDAMPAGGKLTIETQNAHLDHGYVAHNAEVAPGQYVVICVSDTGTGMDAATLDRVFEPFFTTKEVGKGTGLGLSMVYGFVKQSGGHVKVYSEVGEGTTVKIYLPRLLGTHEEDEETEAAIVPEGTRDETILVCEDDNDVRAYSVEVLRELGYRVIEAADGPAALRLLEREQGRVDLLFTDVVLPGGMTGAVLAEEARKLRPEIKILFTTGYARNAIVHHGRLDPGVELITKPFSFADLAARVRDLLDARPVSSG